MAEVRRRTSAHRQLRAYETALAEGVSKREALHAVVDLLVRASRQS